MKTHLYLKIALITILFGCNLPKQEAVQPNIIPIPKEQKEINAIFLLGDQTTLYTEDAFLSVANYFKSVLKEKYQIEFTNQASKNQIEFQMDSTILKDEGYRLAIDDSTIQIAAKSTKGAFYAIQTLFQIMPIENKSGPIAIQGIHIEDEPEFSYRGMHLDVARHFFSIDFIKKYLDLMAMLKMNTFHWHLTEDQGWRIEIKQYPKLQEIAAYRDETLIGHYSNQPHQFDGKRYGGYYTQEEIKDIVAYAAERQITIIPEIEMPGHSTAAIAAYPKLGCTGEQINVATKWGVFEDIYCPKESTFIFLENVLDEVMALFPGKYIHIGGDEAPKTRWKNCKHCQELIKKEGLKDEHGLQSYFITRMERYINSKGKQIIGWDEILEGGLAPNATVMSWRGVQGAVDAAKQGHDVILTPGSHCYFDHYQSDHESEPLAIGGYLPLEKVYSFNPIPDGLTKEEETYVLGAQGNLWTEYIPTPEQAEYMVFPRAVALSEVLWSQKEKKSYDDFIHRLEFFNKRLDAMRVNYANHIYDVKGKLLDKNGNLFYELSTTTNKPIRYFTPDSESTLYNDPIPITTSVTLNAAVFDKAGKQLGRSFTQDIQLHKAVGAAIELNVSPDRRYDAGGKRALINGISGNNKRYGDAEWLGFSGDDVEITLRFKEPIAITKLSTRFHNGNGQWIYAPKQLQIKFNGEQSATYPIKHEGELLVAFSEVFDKQEVSEVQITVPNFGKIPEGKQGAGYRAWTFIDELIIE